jgi:SRSO17 transposase
MSTRQKARAAPGPLEKFAERFDGLFSKVNQRDRWREYLEGLLLPTERNKTLTGLANTEPKIEAQDRRAQKLQWFLTESTWDEQAVNRQRLALLGEEESTAPTAAGVLVIDETGDRKDGSHTAHVGRQYLANRGKIDNGVVSVTSLWADERLYYPVEVEPYTPASWFEGGKANAAFRTKPEIALELVQRAVRLGIAFRAVVADSFYGEHAGFCNGLHKLDVSYVLALKPSHRWWHRDGEPGSLQEVAAAAGWKDAQQPGQWVRITRTFRDGHPEAWWALEAILEPTNPEPRVRSVVVTTDPGTLPEPTTWYLSTNLPAPNTVRAKTGSLPAVDLVEVVRLYGLRRWVEQSYKQVKTTLGWAQYQVRSDRAIRRHWTLVYCAFTFCWWHASSSFSEQDPPLLPPVQSTSGRHSKKKPLHQQRPRVCWSVALRQVRAWLQPWILLSRFWRAWSPLPPPFRLQQLLDWVWQGYPLNLYVPT